MTSACKFGVQEHLEHGDGVFGAGEAGGHDEDVGVVVLAGQTCYLHVPAEGGAYALVLVEGDGHALAGAAHGDAGIDLSGLDGAGEGMGEVGIVDGSGGVGAEILVFDAGGGEIAFDDALEFKSGVVAAQTHRNSGFKY